MGLFRRSPSPAASQAPSPVIPSSNQLHPIATDGNGRIATKSSPYLSPEDARFPQSHPRSNGSSRAASPNGLFEPVSPSPSPSPVSSAALRFNNSSGKAASVPRDGHHLERLSPTPPRENVGIGIGITGALVQSSTSSSSPWAGYLDTTTQISSHSLNNQKASSSSSSPNPATTTTATPKTPSKKERKKLQAQQERLEEEAKERAVHLRRLERELELTKKSENEKNRDLARFSVNGMLNMVEMRMSLEEREDEERRKQASSSARPAQRIPPSRANVNNMMHSIGEEPEEVLSSTTSTTSFASTSASRTRTTSNASDATTALREEVHDLLLLARKASSSMRGDSSYSINSSKASVDISRCQSSAGSVQIDRPASGTTTTTSSSKSDRSLVSSASSSRNTAAHPERVTSPIPTPTSTPHKQKKKFGLFGLSRKDDAVPTMPERAASPSPMFSSAAATEGRSKSPTPLGGGSSNGQPKNGFQPLWTNAAMAERHYGALTPGVLQRAGAVSPLPTLDASNARTPQRPRHDRKRSMSVSDASAFAPIARVEHFAFSPSKHVLPSLAGPRTAHLQHRPKPSVYDESYFSSLKTPYYSSLSEGERARQLQMERLGLALDGIDLKEESMKQQVEDLEEESLAAAKDRLRAQARIVAGHPNKLDHPASATSLQYAVRPANTQAAAPTSATASSSTAGAGEFASTSSVDKLKRQGTVLKQAVPRLNRSNSDASILDPFIPDAAPGESTEGIESGNGTSASSVQKRPPRELRLLQVKTGRDRLSPVPASPASPPSLSSALSSSSLENRPSIGPPPAMPLPVLPPRSTSASSAYRPPKQDLSLSPAAVPALSPLPSSSPALSASSPRLPGTTQTPALAPTPSPAPTSPLPPLPAAICSPPPLRSCASAPVTSVEASQQAKTSASATNAYEFELRPHRTRQQGRTKKKDSPISPPDSPVPSAATPTSASMPAFLSTVVQHAGSKSTNATHTLALPSQPIFGTKGIHQRLPSALDMTLLPTSKSSSSSSNSSSTCSIEPISPGLPTPTPRDMEKMSMSQRQRERQETTMTVASQYSIEGEYQEAQYAPKADEGEGYGKTYENHARRSSRGDSFSSESIHGPLSRTMTATSSTATFNSMTSSRPSLSMDGHTESEGSVSTHEEHDISFSTNSDTHQGGGRTFNTATTPAAIAAAAAFTASVRDDTMAKLNGGRRLLQEVKSNNGSNDGSDEEKRGSVNLAGIGLSGASAGSFPHSRRMHFGWQRTTKAVRNLSDYHQHPQYQHDQLQIQQQQHMEYSYPAGIPAENAYIHIPGCPGMPTPSPEPSPTPSFAGGDNKVQKSATTMMERESHYAAILDGYTGKSKEFTKSPAMMMSKTGGVKTQTNGEDEGYIGSSPEMVSTGKTLQKTSTRAGQRHKSVRS